MTNPYFDLVTIAVADKWKALGAVRFTGTIRARTGGLVLFRYKGNGNGVLLDDTPFRVTDINLADVEISTASLSTLTVQIAGNTA